MVRYIFVGMLLLVQVANAQTGIIDSLKTQLKVVKGEERLSILLNLAQHTRSEQPTESIRYASEVLDALKGSPDAEMEIEALFQIGWAHIYQRDYQSAMQVTQQLDSVSNLNQNRVGLARSYLLKGRIAREQEDYDFSIANLDSAVTWSENTASQLLKLQILNELGSLYRRKGSNNKALEYHRQALEISNVLEDDLSKSTTLGYIGIIHDIMGNYDEALKAHQQSLQLRRKMKDQRGVAASLTNIGILHQKIKNYDEAIAFYNQALSIWIELDRELEQAATYNNLGGVQDLLGNDDEALKYYQNALEIWKRYNDRHGVSIALRNIGAIKVRQGNLEEALDMHQQALEIGQGLGDQFGSASSMIDMAELYLKLGQPNSALEAAHEGLALAEATDSWPLIRDSHQMLSELYENLGQYDEALEHHKAYKAANDSVFNIDSQSIIAELQEEYKTKEQQQQIAAFKQREQIQGLRFWILAGGTALFGIVSVLIYSRYRFKKRAHEALEQLHEKEIEQARLETEKAEATANYLHAENERKSLELEAARTLQLSMLPSEIPQIPYVKISALMKTATEVGGDYYDFDVAEDGTLTVVIGDATGHGVKAGTIVTATKSLFNLLGSNTSLPDMLQQCSKSIQKMKLPKLYMALALLRLRNNTVQLAGAGMPPALVYRAKSRTVEEIPLKGMPLGSTANYPYQEKQIMFNYDDVLFLCTDGFPELFNAEGKMFGYDRVPELLMEVGEKSPEQIIDHFKTAASQWIGDSSPGDDITFLVLKSTA